MNILLTCVGRRSYLVNYFKCALRGRGVVIGANSTTMTTGMQLADKSYKVPRVDSPDYIDSLLKICRDNEVKLVVSLFDIDLPYLAMARPHFLAEGIEVAVSDPWVIGIANDKWKTASFLKERNIATPKTYLNLEMAFQAIDKKEVCYPVVVKPRWGMGSISVFKADNTEELAFFYHYIQRQLKNTYLHILGRETIEESVIIQEFIAGEEYGLDIFNDLQGQYLATAVKRKIAMRSGETDIAEIVDNPALLDLAVMLSDILKHRANIDVDILVGADQIPKVLEINARFGGGYPFSHIAGANFTGALVAIANGEPAELGYASPGTIGMKSIQPLIYNTGNE